MSVCRFLQSFALIGVAFFCLGVASVWAAENKVALSSPNGALTVGLSCDSGAPVLQTSYLNKQVLLPSKLGLAFEPAINENFDVVEIVESEKSEEWSPVWGENSTIRDAYRGVVVTLRESGGARTIQLEVRAYDEGVAYRFVLPESENDWTIVSETSALAFAPDCDSWPLASTEDVYPTTPVKIGDCPKTIFSPLTVRTSDGVFASVLEGSGCDYPRMLLQNLGEGRVGFRLFGPAKLSGRQIEETPWRVVMIAPDERALVANEDFFYNFAKPCQMDDLTWLAPGKTISNEANCDINTDKLLSMVDFAAACGMKYVQIDWGWYGTEWPWTKEEQDTWAKTNPDHADNPEWRGNCEADPFTVAKGLVPYSPTWKSMTWVDLDLPKLVEYGRAKGVGICLYVNDRVLKTNDLERLFSEYERWGLAGLKPGFVKYGVQEHEKSIEDMIEIAARHKLWLCVHDEYLPNGYSRAYPNLYSVEGGSGQEGGRPSGHDVTLPFGRGLAGPFDYTPMLYVKGKSRAHQLSLLVTIYNPAPVIRGGWVYRNDKPEGGFGQGFGDEIEFLTKLDTDWVKTRVLQASVGRSIAIARQTKSGAWNLGATCGEEGTAFDVSLHFLTPNVKYRASVWRDSDDERDGWRPAVKEESIVDSTSVLHLDLKANGGAVAILEPIERSF